MDSAAHAHGSERRERSDRDLHLVARDCLRNRDSGQRGTTNGVVMRFDRPPARRTAQ